MSTKKMHRKILHDQKQAEQILQRMSSDMQKRLIAEQQKYIKSLQDMLSSGQTVTPGTVKHKIRKAEEMLAEQMEYYSNGYNNQVMKLFKDIFESTQESIGLAHTNWNVFPETVLNRLQVAGLQFMENYQDDMINKVKSQLYVSMINGESYTDAYERIRPLGNAVARPKVMIRDQMATAYQMAIVSAYAGCGNPQDYEYHWYGPSDERTTDVCEERKARNPYTWEEVKEMDQHPHVQCRHRWVAMPREEEAAEEEFTEDEEQQEDQQQEERQQEEQPKRQDLTLEEELDLRKKAENVERVWHDYRSDVEKILAETRDGAIERYGAAYEVVDWERVHDPSFQLVIYNHEQWNLLPEYGRRLYVDEYYENTWKKLQESQEQARALYEKRRQENVDAIKKVVSKRRKLYDGHIEPTWRGTVSKESKKAFEDNMKMLPEEWIKNSNVSKLQVETARGRAYYWEATPEMVFTPGDRRAALHEFGHHLEYKNEDVRKAILEFYEYRTKDDVLEKLNELYPNIPYNDREVTKKDRWCHAYYGKYYTNRAGEQDSTEILSMGLEDIFFMPRVNLWKADPELAKFIMKLLVGAI